MKRFWHLSIYLSIYLSISISPSFCLTDRGKDFVEEKDSLSKNEADSLVYLCNGNFSYAYHKSKACKGLENCFTQIDSISVDSAKFIGRTPCGFCYGNENISPRRHKWRWGD